MVHLIQLNCIRTAFLVLFRDNSDKQIQEEIHYEADHCITEVINGFIFLIR